ncbi:biotin-dependent carboxyltransferase family protein [Marinobacter salinisoli]|uniref:Biotin-dependent carboxyltransferase family protein n=1 Tax=Marinobacter salinisoli TaxID=2769486 RepID=A0ABX7MNH1_9GAMM|nr:biotin-dependent carboxyltransferase family protein [Marinobacter salinisoli]QSP93805.1 biotin-dependent carboxyltransferase family protein [Marinobacter salinisoli]
MKLFEVLRPGPRTTVQDAGRRHYQRHGLAQGGAADRFAYLIANKLLDNDPAAASLEITLGGLGLRVLAETTAAITGADCLATLNGLPIKPWQSLAVKPGDKLCFSSPASGRYTYLAVRGGLRSIQTFGSRSVVVRERIEGLEALREGTVLIGQASPAVPARQLPNEFQPGYEDTLQLRMVPGYQHEQFSVADRARVITTTYQVSAQSDRMGFRLEGARLRHPPPGIVSEGIAFGSVQVPGDGNPVVLLQDRQTIGGYPKLGTVIAVDCYRLAQARPGQAVQFQWVDIAEAQTARLLFEEWLKQSRWTETGSLTWA